MVSLTKLEWSELLSDFESKHSGIVSVVALELIDTTEPMVRRSVAKTHASAGVSEDAIEEGKPAGEAQEGQFHPKRV